MDDSNRHNGGSDRQSVIDVTVKASEFIVRVILRGPVAIAAAVTIALLVLYLHSDQIVDTLTERAKHPLVAPAIELPVESSSGRLE